MPLKDLICRRITGWWSKNLSWAGREVLIKAVAQPVPTYAMSVFKLPSNSTHFIQSSICNYLWGHENGKHKIHRLSTSSAKVNSTEDLTSKILRRSILLYWLNKFGAYCMLTSPWSHVFSKPSTTPIVGYLTLS